MRWAIYRTQVSDTSSSVHDAHGCSEWLAAMFRIAPLTTAQLLLALLIGTASVGGFELLEWRRRQLAAGG